MLKQTKRIVMAKDRYTTLKKWLVFKTTELNHNTGKVETHTQEEWIKIKNPHYNYLSTKK